MAFFVLLAIGAIIGAIFFRLAERKNRKGTAFKGRNQMLSVKVIKFLS